MSDPQDTRPALLVLHADGSIEIPAAKTYGDALAIFAVIERAAQALRAQLAAQPLPERTP